MATFDNTSGMAKVINALVKDCERMHHEMSTNQKRVDASTMGKEHSFQFFSSLPRIIEINKLWMC